MTLSFIENSTKWQTYTVWTAKALQKSHKEVPRNN